MVVEINGGNGWKGDTESRQWQKVAAMMVEEEGGCRWCDSGVSRLKDRGQGTNCERGSSMRVRRREKMEIAVNFCLRESDGKMGSVKKGQQRVGLKWDSEVSVRIGDREQERRQRNGVRRWNERRTTMGWRS
ncbi:hypothetical protein AMTR_s00031p00199770 [Amborella trichopoda]|uniref:Uncharacterized protein n=1 Tax=Amborella trichopoda TaxID=13333 RepID=U5D890_AMBTC|nr:hypothetical protein AMTR_s00031p00199770 [Amborella trichopoda]